MSDSSELAKFDLIQKRCDTLRETLGQVIVGQESMIEPLLAAVLCQGHTLIVGVPGLAKTLLVRTLASAMDLSFRRIQFTPDMMPTDILGTELIQEDPATGRRELRFFPGPIFAQLILADEINRTPPRTQAALLEAMAERQVTTAGRTLPLDQPFVVVATQNPIEQEGTYPLPEAQLDRFMFSLWMDYPDRKQEVAIVARSWQIAHQHVQQVFTRDELVETGRLIRQMPVSEHVIQYAVDLARATRPSESPAWAPAKKYIAWGAGPRAGQCLVLGAQALAAIQGKPTPSCDHVRAIASAVLRHRIVVNYAATGDHVSAADLVEELLADIKEPQY
jgi:MoxR-like ATPase